MAFYDGIDIARRSQPYARWRRKPSQGRKYRESELPSVSIWISPRHQRETRGRYLCIPGVNMRCLVNGSPVNRGEPRTDRANGFQAVPIGTGCRFRGAISLPAAVDPTTILLLLKLRADALDRAPHPLQLRLQPLQIGVAEIEQAFLARWLALRGYFPLGAVLHNARLMAIFQNIALQSCMEALGRPDLT
jgi:hypothetical protein